MKYIEYICDSDLLSYYIYFVLFGHLNHVSITVTLHLLATSLWKKTFLLLKTDNSAIIKAASALR